MGGGGVKQSDYGNTKENKRNLNIHRAEHHRDREEENDEKKKKKESKDGGRERREREKGGRECGKNERRSFGKRGVV